MKTFYENWVNEAPGYTNLGSFQTLLMQAYRAADSQNRKKMGNAFPDYFVLPHKEEANTLFKTA